MRSLEGLSRALREVPDASTSAASWQALVGDAYPLISGCLTRSKELSQGWPCGAPGGSSWGCTRTLVEHSRTDIDAVCDERSCPTVKVIRGDAVRQTLDLAKLAEALVPALHLHEPPVGGKPLRLLDLDSASVLLGVVRLDERIALALSVAHGPTRLASVGAAARAAGKTDRALVIAPVAGASIADTLAPAGVDVAALDELFTLVDGEPRARLLDYVRRHYTSSVDPSPWFDGAWDLVLDPAQHRAWTVSGATLDFSGKRTPGRLLYALAQRPNAWVSRVELAEVVYGVDGDPTPLPKRKSELQGMLTAAGCGIEIGTLEASDDEDGAYRLPIAPGRVEFWSPLTALPDGTVAPQRNPSGRRKSAAKPVKRK